MTRSISLVVLLLVVALGALLTNAPPTTHAEGTADDVADIDLAKMTLPLSAFGSDYTSFLRSADTGFGAEEDRIDGERNSYFLYFDNPDEEITSGPASIGSGAISLEPGLDAATVLAYLETALLAAAKQEGASVETFPVLGFDAALGFEETFESAQFGFFVRFTAVVFGSDQLLSIAAAVRLDDADARVETTNVANALRDRLKGVLTGKVTDFPAPLPPDVNCNGSLDAIDASLILQLGAALVDALPCDALGDANQDGQINAVDASLILQYSAGLIDQVPVDA